MQLVSTPETVADLTRHSTLQRLDDGRPRVPDAVLDRLELATTEQAWSTLRRAGYHDQFEGGWLRTHPRRKLIGRAVTAMFVPRRPDLDEVVHESGLAQGHAPHGRQNSWVIETLQPRDVLVVDLFGKVKDGTFVGDQLATAVRARTLAGAVIDGGIRDFDGVRELDDVAFFCRGLHPTAIRDVTLVGVNVPVRIGAATVLPGDVVLGSATGVTFVPAHAAEQVADEADDVRARDRFGRQRLGEGRYSPGQVDSVWTAEIEADFASWRESGGR